MPSGGKHSFWSGLRGRLLLAFAAISGFVLLAGGIGFYGLIRSGESLDEIAKREVPVVIAALGLAQSSERMVSAGPTLSNTIDPADLRVTDIMIQEELDRARDLLTELRDARLDRATIIEIGDKLDRLSANLTSINAAVRRRMAAAGRKAALLRGASLAYLQFGEA